MRNLSVVCECLGERGVIFLPPSLNAWFNNLTPLAYLHRRQTQCTTGAFHPGRTSKTGFQERVWGFMIIQCQRWQPPFAFQTSNTQNWSKVRKILRLFLPSFPELRTYITDQRPPVISQKILLVYGSRAIVTERTAIWNRVSWNVIYKSISVCQIFIGHENLLCPLEGVQTLR